MPCWYIPAMPIGDDRGLLQFGFDLVNEMQKARVRVPPVESQQFHLAPVRWIVVRRQLFSEVFEGRPADLAEDGG